MICRTATTRLAGALLAAGALFLAACAAGPQSGPAVHPEKLSSPPLCTSCHDADRASGNHDSAWMKSHGAAAARERRSCELCHRQSYCADCHGIKEEIKPSNKRGSRFDASTPHRGDYLTQHRIDGRLDPASCFPCHGRKNDGRCRVCHK